MIIHIPHDPGEGSIPEGYDGFIGTPIPMDDVGAYDFFTRVAPSGAKTIRFGVSRLVCDVERFIDGEPMEEKGMGICYERNAMLEPLREVTPEYRADVIERFYKPHHELLESAVEDELASYGMSVIADAHTFYPEPWPYEDDKIRPQVCLGCDGKDAAIAHELHSVGIGLGLDVMVNRPFSGAIKPLRYMHDERVVSIMFEVNQAWLGDASVSWYIGDCLERLAGLYRQ